MKLKAFFIVFEGLSFGEKNKNLMKTADTSFKSSLKNFIFLATLFCAKLNITFVSFIICLYVRNNTFRSSH